jgi:2'-5' RNA ligase
MNGPPARRLFFALWPDSRVRRRLTAAVRPLLDAAKGRAVADSRLHMTLAFLGAIPAEQVEAVLAAGDQVAGERFCLCLNRWSWWRHSKILLLAPTAPPAALEELVAELREALGDEGLPVERRRFKPHVTLARGCTGVRYRGPVDNVDWTVDEFVLAESEFHSAGARYNILRRWGLTPGTEGKDTFSDNSTSLETVGGEGL